MGRIKLFEMFDKERVMQEFANIIEDKIKMLQKELDDIENTIREKERKIYELEIRKNVESSETKDIEIQIEKYKKDIEELEEKRRKLLSSYTESRNYISLAGAFVFYPQDERVKRAEEIIIEKLFKERELTSYDKEILQRIGAIYLPKVKEKLSKKMGVQII